MKKTSLMTAGFIALLSIAFYSFATSGITTMSKEIQWITFEEAIALKATYPEKKILVNVYTDWCKWCKVMDDKTFTDLKVAAYVNTHYLPVKFNAEQKNDIEFKGKTYSYTKSGQRGIHQLAYELMDRSASFPSVVLLDENMKDLSLIKGFKSPEGLMTELAEFN